jgi:RNA polymerase-binding protein DksA
MKKAELQEFKNRLAAMRARLVGDVNAMADSALNKTGGEANGNLSNVPIHMADLGTDAYEQEFTISRIENEEELLESIEAALARIESGEFGTCTQCGAKIPKVRLNAIPYTPFCIKCAELNEV